MERIKEISKYIDDNSKVIDIGCDHGYLGIELINQNRNIKVISSDISSNAIASAMCNISSASLDDKIELRVGNGLDVISPSEIDTVVISGLGAHTQIEILTSGLEKLKFVDSIILCPNDDAYYIRNNLEMLGYHIYDEDIIYENDKFYPILKLKKGIKKYTYEECLLGPILQNKTSKIIAMYYKMILDKKNNIYNKLPNKYISKREDTLNDINIIKRHLS